MGVNVPWRLARKVVGTLRLLLRPSVTEAREALVYRYL